MQRGDYDAVVVGAGPNGLTAAVMLARHGLRVLVLERNAEIGGGCRTAELTLPGFRHDICAAIHPMGVLSPAFQQLELEAAGLQWIRTTSPVAHPLPDGSVAVLEHKPSAMNRWLGSDGQAWSAMVEPFATNPHFFSEILRPIRFPHHPLTMLRFGMLGLRSAESIARRFSGIAARALFAGCAAHSFLPLDAPASASFGLVLAIAGHALDWPCAQGGSSAVINALAVRLREAGGEIRMNSPVDSIAQLPFARAILLDLTPRQIASIARDELPSRYVQELKRYQYGPGVFKMDWALSQRIPWKNPECHRAATVHVGGTFEEVAASEEAASSGRSCSAPFVLVAQQSLFDTSRAPVGKHTGWAYCHVPHGSREDMTDAIERQIERFAPGFRDTIIARHVMNTGAVEAHNANMIGGDIGGGANTLRQFLFRPAMRWNPYTTPNPRLFICSSSTPPGGAVHGMCGYWSAKSALKRVFDKS